MHTAEQGPFRDDFEGFVACRLNGGEVTDVGLEVESPLGMVVRHDLLTSFDGKDVEYLSDEPMLLRARNELTTAIPPLRMMSREMAPPMDPAPPVTMKAAKLASRIYCLNGLCSPLPSIFILVLMQMYVVGSNSDGPTKSYAEVLPIVLSTHYSSTQVISAPGPSRGSWSRRSFGPELSKVQAHAADHQRHSNTPSLSDATVNHPQLAST